MKKSDPPKYMVRKVLDNDRHGDYWSWDVYNSKDVVVAKCYTHERAEYAAWLLNGGEEGRSCGG